ncbi:MAG TPA: stage II sporulation protein M [Desulfobulbus sp.]|nr:stage II sporulation protein M [Desulfobulbus sp.]
MMRQEQFEIRYGPLWKRLETQLALLENGRAASSGQEELAAFPSLYRQVCNHYALAHSRCYGPDLVARLHRLVLRGHQQLYQPQRAGFRGILEFAGYGFPRTVRAHWHAFWLAFLLFYLPAGVSGLLCYHDPTMIYSVMDENRVSRIEYMYDPRNRKTGRTPDRTSETDLRMFGYYIYNNVAIGFRTFAGGMFLGLGTVFFLLFNGLTLGSVAGHLSHQPFAAVFWPFVAGHGAFELTAIVISGASGLLLAGALLRPGNRSRTVALRHIAPEAVRLVMGAMGLFVLAALVEAFWSPLPVNAGIRFVVAAFNWLLVMAYLLWAGKGHGS